MLILPVVKYDPEKVEEEGLSEDELREEARETLKRIMMMEKSVPEEELPEFRVHLEPDSGGKS